MGPRGEKGVRSRRLVEGNGKFLPIGTGAQQEIMAGGSVGSSVDGTVPADGKTWHKAPRMERRTRVKGDGWNYHRGAESRLKQFFWASPKLCGGRPYVPGNGMKTGHLEAAVGSFSKLPRKLRGRMTT